MTTKILSKSELNALKLPELKALAKDHGVRRISSKKKQELIDALLEATATPEKHTPETPAPKNTAPQEPPSDIEKPHSDKPSDDTATKTVTRTRRTRRGASAPQGVPQQQTLDIKQELLADVEAGTVKTTPKPEEETPAQTPKLDLPEGPTRDEKTQQRRGRERRRRRDRSDNERRTERRNDTTETREENDTREEQRRVDAERRADTERRVEREARQRTRQRNRDNSAGDTENEAPAQHPEDMLIPIAGILDIQPNHAFVRTSGYLPGPNDIYVTLGQVRRWALRSGDAIVGAVRPRTDVDQTNRRQKFNALVRLDTVNGMSIEDARKRKEFKNLTPLYPQEQLRLETTAKNITTRAIDLVAPIGKGQRGLIVSPPKAGKTIVLQQIANAITQNNPECHLMVVLVDERPEEVTDMQRTVKGEVIASTFDRPSADHATVAELAIERAKRLVEMDQDVVVLLDSITRLGRAYNIAAPPSGRILTGGVDASALYPPKKFFGAARNVENGGSLTILATALVETGSKMDEVIFEEFKGTGNMELRLSRELADKRVFPAVDVQASGTRREELLLTKEELAITWKLRRMLGALDNVKATEFVLSKLKDTQSNAEFLLALAKMTPAKD